MSGRTFLLGVVVGLSMLCMAAAQCPVGDLDGDCRVDWVDMEIMAGQWLDSVCAGAGCADLDHLSGVDMVDFAMLAANWLEEHRQITIVINEFMAANTGFLRDEYGDADDWVELYNFGDAAIDVGGMYMSDGLDTPWIWPIPTNNSAATTIPAHGYLLIWADREAGEGTLHGNFKLDADNGEQIGFFDLEQRLVDSVVFGRQQDNYSYGRFPDAGATWRVFASPTPRGPNKIEPVKIVITEIMFHPYHPVPGAESVGEEYIELFNAGNEAVELGGWRFADGVDFVFPNVTLQKGAYLVVAADADAFAAKYPTVTNVVGGWTGWLSNSGETIEVVDSGGVVIDSVEYCDEGDWAIRELGPVDRSHRGWQWSDQTDGGGRSLELINIAMPNEYGQNWAAGDANDGTPGKVNSVAAYDVAPLILDVGHRPIIPRPADQVTVTARVLDELPTTVTVKLHYRVDQSQYSANAYPHYQAGSYSELPMSDDGAHGDGLAGDGVYGAVLPAQANGKIVELYVAARDAGNKTRTWPAPSVVDDLPEQVTNLLYQVDASFDANAPWVAEDDPIYYVIMTEMERGRLAYVGSRSNGEEDSDAQMNGTFISRDGTGMECRYTVGVRNRGHGTRTGPPNNYHVHFAHDRPWQGVTAINFNCRYTHSQIIGGVLFRMAGLAAPVTIPAQLRINGANLAVSGSPMYGVYVRLEAFDDDFANNSFPDDADGNLYTCFRDGGEADLQYEGMDPDKYRNHYFKSNHEAQDDWSDLIHLVDVLNNAPEATYFQDVNAVVNVRQWLRYIALDALLLNCETGLNTGIGDDYFMYRGVVDPRFVLVPHDLDTVLGQGNTQRSMDQSIFSIATGVGGYNGVDGLKRFFDHPEVIALYYQAALDLINEFYNNETLNPLFDQILGGFTPVDRINAMKQFVSQRRAAVLLQIPRALTITSNLPIISGYRATPGKTISLSGTGDVVRTRSILVNGRVAQWSARPGTWTVSNVPVNPGINRVIVECFDEPNGTGDKVDSAFIDIWYNDATVTAISGTVATSRVLDAASGPWSVTGDIVIPNGVTLTIEPGATVYFDAGAGITVQSGGRLVAEGTRYARIRFTRAPGTTHTWDGLTFDHTLEDNRLAFVDQEFGDGQGESVDIQYSRVLIEDVTWAGAVNKILELSHPTLTVKNCIFPSLAGTELIHGSGLSGSERLVFEGCTFGTTTGYKDIIDFSGAHAPGPILELYSNVFLGGSDDGADLDSADAYIEGNTFMNFHKNQSGDSDSAAIATGAEGGGPSTVYVVRNIFVDNDHAILVKEGCVAWVQHNVFVDSNIAAISFGEPDRNPPRSAGKGAHLAGNVCWNNAAIFKHYFQQPHPQYGPSELTVNQSILPAQWHHLGQGNIDADPLFVDSNGGDFHLRSMSPGIGSGPCGLDMGVYAATGAAICGEPEPITYRTSATLYVGGPGITHYKYAVNNPAGPWSAERSVDLPIELSALLNGQSYTVYVVGKSANGVWQSQSDPTVSATWAVNTSYRQLVINEIFAHTHGADPDLIELFYDGPSSIDLTDMSLSDDPGDPRKFIFSSQTVSKTTMNPGEYMVLYGDMNVQLKDHLGFALSADGEAMYLYDKPSNGGGLLDSVVFGPQINFYSIGRIGRNRQWKLNQPTLGAANVVQSLGDPSQLKINEWFARGLVLFEDDFVELYNPLAVPVDISDLYLTDNPVTQPCKSRLGPLSFIAPNGYTAFVADEANEPGHLDFKLSSDGEMIGLYGTDRKQIDQVLYGPQTTDVSQGRVPDGNEVMTFFGLPTPGAANPVMPTTTVTTVTLVPEVADKWAIVPISADHVASEWNSSLNFDTGGWAVCTGAPGGIGYERSSGYDPLIGLDMEAAMYSKNATCYVRIPFSVDANSLAELTGLVLKVRYDDAFIAYLNGVVVESRNFTDTPQWNSGTTVSREASIQSFDEYIDISDHIGDLKAGQNLLAIHGINGPSTTSSDFLISVELEGSITHIVGEEYPYKEALNLLDGLRITELMYHAQNGDNFDYIELMNIGDEVLDLNGVRLTEGVEFTFGAKTLEPGKRIVVAANIVAFRSVYGVTINVVGSYSGSLSNGGEDIVLNLPVPLDAAIMRFGYSDTWYSLTDGGGGSLTIRDPTAHPSTWNDPASWQAAMPSPGRP